MIIYCSQRLLTKSFHTSPDQEHITSIGLTLLQIIASSKPTMKLVKLYILLGASWISSVAAGNTRGSIKFTARNLQELNASMVDEVQMVDAKTTEVNITTESAESPADVPHGDPVVEVVAAKDYSSSDFEFVSTRPSSMSRSSKGSKRGGRIGKERNFSSSKKSGGNYKMAGQSKPIIST